ARYLELAERMQFQLNAVLWDEKSGYLLNMIDSSQLDRHFYAGSILAAAYGLLDNGRRERLLQAVREQLLDSRLGVRNVMPPDFHELVDLYRFNGPEMGQPYVYINGGVWPQGNVWYALGLLAAGQPDSAKQVLQKYLTLQGIRQSPNGQPSFYEYRNADPDSPDYGKIDKPTFMWAGGLYLHALYNLFGLRENSWNLSFNAAAPSGLETAEYDLMLFGRKCRVRFSGNGSYFRRILKNGSPDYSAVVYGPACEYILERGKPETPYLATADCKPDSVRYSGEKRQLFFTTTGISGKTVQVKVVSPLKLNAMYLNKNLQKNGIATQMENGVYLYSLSGRQTASALHWQLQF
ncbi:MAG: hypothetical protein WAN36_07470, partial [Calditrichia bacterium]